MVCTPDLYYQEFVVNGAELRRYKHKFLKRLDMYYDLLHDEKEQAKVKIRGGLLQWSVKNGNYMATILMVVSHG